MIREDCELMAELDRVTKQIVNFTLGILGADPVSIEAQRYLGERMIATGARLRDRAEAGDAINGYVNGTVHSGLVIEAADDE